jgi:hypothetical protein
MKYRLIAAILCTVPSFMALGISLKINTPLFISTWAIYFLILFFWVKNNCAPKTLLIIGTVLGVTSVVLSNFVALLLAFPSIALMVHVIKCSFFPLTPNKAL